IGHRRDLLRALGPQRLLQLLAEDHGAAATNGRDAGHAPLPGKAARHKRPTGADAVVYRRVAGGLFRLLAEVGIPLPAGDDIGEAVEEAARAGEPAPALAGVPLAQALRWLQAAP